MTTGRIDHYHDGGVKISDPIDLNILGWRIATVNRVTHSERRSRSEARMETYCTMPTEDMYIFPFTYIWMASTTPRQRHVCNQGGSSR